MSKVGVLSEPVLVGREHELEVLQQHLDSAVQGRGTTVFVFGEAGSGKTRLVNEFLNSSKQKRNVTELTGWCLSNSGVPYFPFIEAFKIYSSGFNKNQESAGLGEIVGDEELGLRAWFIGPEKAGSFGNSQRIGSEELGLKAWLIGPEKKSNTEKVPALSPQAWKDSTFAAVTKTLLSVSAKKPTILFIDDVHWADSASLALLHYISRAITSQRVLVLATFRSEDLNPDSEGRPHPLVDALRLMGRENLYKEIKLPSLSRPAVSLLAENMVGGRIHSAFAEKLASESQGNPLFVVESLKMLSEKGSLVQENNWWRISTDEVGIPTKFKDIILRRVGVLKPDQRKILDIASVIGSKFDPELLGAVLGKDTLEVLETLSNIEKSTSLVVCDGSCYRFCHAKCRDALYEEVSPPLRKAYHGRIADRLGTGWKGDGKLPVGDLAFHYAQAGNREKAVKYALAAGEEALAVFCGAEAIKHFRYVLDNTAEDTAYTNERLTALEGLGDGHFALSRCGEAVRVFEQLSSSADSALVKLRALRKALHAAMIRGDYSKAVELANRTVEDPQLDLIEYARVRMCKGRIKGWGGQTKEALQYLNESLRIIEGEYSLQDMPDLLAEVGSTYAFDGQFENGIALLIRSGALGEYARNLNAQHYPKIYSSFVFINSGLQEQAQEAVAESFKIGDKISDPISRAWNINFSYWMSGQILEANAAKRLFSGLQLQSMRDFGTGAKIKFFMSSLTSGALREFKQGLKAAIAQSLKGEELVEETDSYQARANIYGNLTRQYAELGDMEQAEKYYKKMVKIFDETSLAEIIWAYELFLFSKAVFFSSKHQWKEANQTYEEVIEAYKKQRHEGAIEAGTRQSYCWTLLQQGRFAEAKKQFEEAKRIMDSLENRFVHSNIIGYFMAPNRVEVGREFNMRLDMINVAKKPGVLIKIEGLTPDDSKITKKQPHYNMQNGSIELEKKTINPFTDEAITFTVQATKAGDFKITPQLVYVDDLGETKTCIVNAVNVSVQPVSK